MTLWSYFLKSCDSWELFSQDLWLLGVIFWKIYFLKSCDSWELFSKRVIFWRVVTLGSNLRSTYLWHHQNFISYMLLQLFLGTSTTYLLGLTLLESAGWIVFLWIAERKLHILLSSWIFCPFSKILKKGQAFLDDLAMNLVNASSHLFNF